MLIDITQTIRQGMVYREGSPAFKAEKVDCFVEHTSEAYTTTVLSCAVHNMGTHIDIMTPVDLDHGRFIAEGVKFDVSGITDRPAELKDIDTAFVKEGCYVFFQTGWDRYLNKNRYLNHPEISMDIIRYLVDKKVNMVGIDTPGLARDSNHGIIDRFLAKHGIYTIENLTNLGALPEKGFKVYCFPLKIEALEAVPARILVEI